MSILLHPMFEGARGKIAAWLAALGLTLSLAGCATFEPPAARTEAAIPPAAPRTTGVDTPGGREHKRLIALFGGELRAPAAEALLNEALAKLAVASDSPGEAYKVTLLNSPAVNAFALPGGNLYVTRGLLALANDTSEIAAVMAHEIAHISAKHAAQRAEHERKAALVSRVVSEVLEKPLEGNKIQALEQIRLASFSRQQELDADKIGVQTIARAGFDPYGASRFLASLGRSTELNASIFGQKSSSGTDFLATHPATPERVSQAVAIARQFGSPGIGETQRARYRQAIAGLPFGDTANDGMIRGHSFVHPKLGFAITAPDGYSLENSRKALLGVTSEGDGALRLDSVRLSGATSLEAYVGSGWIEGLQAGTIETTTINGLPAAIALAKGKDWTFRFGAVRLGADVYRIIFAARNLTPDTDAAFRASIQSFHRLGHDEAASARPLHIELITASGGDTAETMAHRMGVSEKPLEQFLLLNGLERIEALKPGEIYKIVAE